MNPREIAKQLSRNIPDYMELVSELPTRLKDLMSQARKGRFRMQITIPEFELLLRKLDRISNQLSFSIVLLSFSILMAGLIIGSSMGHQNTMLWKFPAIEIGFGVALLLFLWLIYSIFRTGRF